MWIAYIVGIIATLAWKLARYVYFGRKASRAYREIILEWLFGKQYERAENSISWLTTVGVMLMVGWLYIEGVEWEAVPVIGYLPQHWTVAFTLATIIEHIAPAFAKRIYRRFEG